MLKRSLQSIKLIAFIVTFVIVNSPMAHASAAVLLHGGIGT